MKRLSAIALAITLLTGLSACKKERLTANGNIITERRNLGQFTGLSSSGATLVEIKYGDDFSIDVKGSSNIVPHYNTRIVNNVLYIGFERANVRGDDIQVVLTMPAIRRISLSGSTSAEIKNNFPAQSNLDVSISGSGNVMVNNAMQVNHVKVEVSGSGKVNFETLNCRQADIDLSGSGIAKLQVEERLKAKISGSGKIYYRGNPQIEQDISGSGQLIKF